jgi:DNA-binding NtrC family response regulator
MKIFLVDDDPNCLQLYAQYLNNLGYTHIQYFGKSSDCVDQLTLNPDLVFLDYTMDNLNGIDVLKRIKRFNPNILVVFISGQEEIDVAVNALKYGALDYITKEDIDQVRISACMEKVVQIREILLKKRNMGVVKKMLTGAGIFSVAFFIREAFAKI